MDTHNFYAGEEFFAHLMLGSLLVDGGVRFRTFAPAAERVELLLNDEVRPMNKVGDGNFWELEVPGAGPGDAYEYRIWHGGTYVDHADPYACQSELRPAHRSIVADLAYEWHDEKWLASRSDCHDKPMNIYELHLGSWHKRSGDQPSDDPADWYTYEELAGCTTPVEEGGLGFDYKWDMGWMHDTLELFQTPPESRPDAYHKLTFSMAYFANERYLLPLSHDEVVHGKATIAQKMAASEVPDKLAQARALYLYQMAHPGKKLNFMGWEIAQLREWDERREQDWFMRSYPAHDAFFRFACELNAAYRNEPALWELDYDEGGFNWLEANGEQDSLEMGLPACSGRLIALRLFN